MKEKNKKRYVIGIDTGTLTGIAIWDRLQREIVFIDQMAIHEAMDKMKQEIEMQGVENILVVVEDARKRKFFRGENMGAKAQGAGSIKRDAAIWEDFLISLNIEFILKTPSNTKVTPEYFERLTKIKTLKTHSHKRDAAMMVLNY